MRPLFRIPFALLAFVFAALLAVAADQNQDDPDSGGTAVLLEIRDAIGPATSDYIVRGIEQATEDGADLIILEMDTPGGLVTSMRDINKAILSSQVPVATFVYPSGAQAASAGTYIMYASHIAAMSPATNLGAATPVSIGPTGGGEPADDDKADDKSDEGAEDEEAEGESAGKVAEEEIADDELAMRRKVVNDSVAYIRGLAELRGRNADWAEEAVRSGVSLPADEALKMNVIDVIATDIGDLLRQIDGRSVKVLHKELTLATTGLVVERLEPDWRTRFLSAITNPNIAILLLMIGIYGLVFEGYNPGAIVPGVVGAICLLLGLFALQALPVNYAGLFLIVLGVVLMVAEAFAPSFGALGIGGVLAFVLGAIFLIRTDVPGFSVSRPLIGGIATVSASILLATIWFAVKTRRSQPVSGAEEMIGSTGEARSAFRDGGTVFIHGEIWNARTSTPVKKGQRVRVLGLDGLILTIEPDSETEE